MRLALRRRGERGGAARPSASLKVAREIVRGIQARSQTIQADALPCSTSATQLQDCSRVDGRRYDVVTGRAGNRQSAFVYLLRLLRPEGGARAR